MADPALVPIAYPDFVAGVEAIADALAADDWQPDHIVGIGRGGLVPGAYLSHRTGISLLSVDYSSGVPAFAEQLIAQLARAAATRAGAGAGQRILLVDDINDSGGTIVALKRMLAGQGADMANVRVAVLIENVRSLVQVEYRARTIDRATDKSWFVFPWEAMSERGTLIEDARAVPARLG